MKSKQFILLISLASVLSAANPTNPQHVSVRLKFMAWDDGMLGCGVRIAGKVVPVAILADHLSDELAYEGPARLEIVRIGTNTPEIIPFDNGKAKPAKLARQPEPTSKINAEPPLAWFNLPVSANGQSLIMAVSPGKWDGGIMAISDRPGSFPPGSLRFFNLCHYPLEVRIGQNFIKIPQNDARSIRGGAKNNDYFDATIMTYEGGEERIGYNLHMFQDNTQRALFFVAAGPEGSGSVVLKGVGDLNRDKIAAPKRLTPAIRK